MVMNSSYIAMHAWYLSSYICTYIVWSIINAHELNIKLTLSALLSPLDDKRAWASLVLACVCTTQQNVTH